MYIQEINYYCFVDAETTASISTTFPDVLTVFSLNFSSSGKGPLMASKAKNLHRRCTFPWLGGGDIGVRDIAPPSLGDLGAKFSETSFPHFKTYFMQIGR